MKLKYTMLKEVYQFQKYTICMKFNKRQHSGIFPLGMLLPEMGHQIAF